MKTTIKLTDEQIESIVRVEKEKLETAFNNEVEKLRSKLSKDLAGLKDKYSNFTLTLGDDKKTRIKFDEKKITELYLDKKSVNEIAQILNYPLSSTRAKIYNMIKGKKLQKRKA